MTLISRGHFSKGDRMLIREELDRILKSGPFIQSRRRQRFLEYVVHETLAGRGERLKGYSIALEVFGRPDTFDPVADPIVRIEAGRLREKLRCYYETDGWNDPVRIALPLGTYRPRIVFRDADSLAPRTVLTQPAMPEENAQEDALLTGLGRFWHYTREACAEAQHSFDEAVEIDPHYAPAHAWLARTYVWQSCMNWVPFAIEPALEHAFRAVEIDTRSVLGHSILGKVRLYLKDGESAVAEATHACTLDPNSAEAKLFLSFILAATGHGTEALRTIKTAMLLQPHSSSYYYETLGLSHFAVGDYDSAIAAFLRGIEINPSYMPCHYELAITHGVRRQSEEAQAEAAIVKADCQNVSADFIVDASLAAIYGRGKQVAGLA
jgi:tetratricopeptide (TPR) repeat protein